MKGNTVKIYLPENHPCAESWNSGRMSEVFKLFDIAHEGRQAYKSNRTRRDNPYPEHTERHDQWDKSFCQALHEDNKQ